MHSSFRCGVILILLLFPPLPATGQDRNDFRPAAGLQRVSKLVQLPDTVDPQPERLAEAIKEISTLRNRGEQCITDSRADLAKTENALSVIGPGEPGEPAEVERQRRQLLERKSTQDKRLSECRLLVVQAGEAIGLLSDARRRQLSSRIFFRAPDLYDTLRGLRRESSGWISRFAGFLDRHSGLTGIRLGEALFGLLITLSTLAIGARLKRHLTQRFGQQAGAAGPGRFFLGRLSRFFPLLLALTILAGYFLALAETVSPPPLTVTCSLLLVIYSLIHIASRSILPSGIVLEPETAGSFERRLRPAGLFFLIGLLAMFYLEPGTVSPASARLLHALSVTLSCLVLPWLFYPIRAAIGGIRYSLLTILLFMTMVAEWLGYLNLAEYLLTGTGGTLLLLAGLKAARFLLDSLFTGLAHGYQPWQKKFRGRLGFKQKDIIGSFLWLRVLLLLALWTTVLLALLRIWGVSDNYYKTVLAWLTVGLHMGQFQLVPLRVGVGLLLFTLLWLLSRWLIGRLKKNWLLDPELEPSAREAVITITGYTGFIVAALVGLTVAGMNFSNLALIAGALSVGIGFGLQNIVNNFVSGLILLFERPIKRGDWIVAGGTEGYVKKIRVRSTVIRTFDRADVIVPNSELISSQVTNWMLSDRRGRVRVPVGVAYGSDTELVRRLLLAAAEIHPEVITDGTVPEPLVLFMEFGESSLNFELRCFLRDIDNRLKTKSELNFAIDRSFREHGIQIPFPQRDLHVKDWPEENGRTFSAADRQE